MTPGPCLVDKRPMRIAYITDETMPNPSASGLQIVQTLAALAEAGADVDMLYPVAPGDRRDAAARRAELEAFFHVPCGFGLAPLPGAVTRWRPPIKVAQAALATRAALQGGYDVVYTRNVGPILPALAAGRPVLFETYRPLTQQYRSSRWPLWAVARHPRFLGVVTHSRYARQAFVEDGLPADRVETVYNGFDPSAFAAQPTPAEARAALGLAEAPTVVYTGRIAPLKRIDLLLDAAEQIPQARWVLVGDADSDEARPLAARARAMPNIQLLGYLTGARLVLALQAADVLVIPPSAQPLEQFKNTVLPIKTFTYLAAGRAILAGRTPDLAELLQDGANARLVRPDDVAALVDGARGLLRQTSERARLGAAARATAESLTWSARAERLLAFIDRRLVAMGRRNAAG